MVSAAEDELLPAWPMDNEETRVPRGTYPEHVEARSKSPRVGTPKVEADRHGRRILYGVIPRTRHIAAAFSCGTAQEAGRVKNRATVAS